MRKITRLLLVTALMPFFTVVYAQNVLTVSSSADNGAGTLRQLIADAAPGDSIVIPADSEIVISSELTLEKNLSINGQGSTIRVENPGVSAIRVFTLTNAALTNGALYNLILKGGNIQGRNATASNILNCGGILLMDVACTFRIENVEFLDSKGTYAGAFQQNNVNANVVLKSCTFSGNTAINNAGALYNKGIMSLENCTFQNNSTTHNGSAIVSNKSLTVRESTFKSNTAATTTNGAYAGAIFNTGNGSVADFTNCLFVENTADTRGAAVFGQSGNTETTISFTNCTFYNNVSNAEASLASNNAGGVFTSYAGIVNLINCTMAGNTARLNGVAFIRDLNTIKVNVVNSIIVYNYTGETVTDLTNEGAGVVNIYYSILGSTTGSINQNNAIGFNYNPESVLFASYYSAGNRMPIIDDDGTLKLSGVNSIAYKTGTAALEGFTIPAEDQLGAVRPSPPSVGAAEHNVSTAVQLPSSSKLEFYPNPATDFIHFSSDLKITSVEIIDLSGSTMMMTAHPMGIVSLQGIPSGMYLLRAYTSEGISTSKIQIQ